LALASYDAGRSKTQAHEHGRVVKIADRRTIQLEGGDRKAPVAMVEEAILPNVSAAERLSDCTSGRVREVKFVIKSRIRNPTETS
jgi:hypothetical protein